MVQSFKSMDELTGYLNRIEERIRTLEAENKTLRSSLTERGAVNKELIASYIADSLPQTDLLSPSLLKRAFAVYGHTLLASFILSAIFFVLYLCFVVVLFGSVLGNLPRIP